MDFSQLGAFEIAALVVACAVPLAMLFGVIAFVRWVIRERRGDNG
jgi:ABC-type sulfate transport system permease subunit